MLVPLDIASITRSSITNSTILGHSTSRMLLERYAHESDARKQAVIAANPGTVGHVLGTPGWAEETVWRQSDEKNEEKVVDGRRLELPTSALRTLGWSTSAWERSTWSPWAWPLHQGQITSITHCVIRMVDAIAMRLPPVVGVRRPVSLLVWLCATIADACDNTYRKSIGH